MQSLTYKPRSIRQKFSALIAISACLVLCFFATLLSSQSSFASTAAIHAIELVNNPKESLKVKISQLSPTRITFSNYSIAEFIGDENKYKIISDSAGLNVFITPKAEIGTIIPVSIITTNNLVQDLLLEVTDKKPLPSSIIIKIPKSTNVLKNKRQTELEATLMLKAMIDDENEGGKYYVTKNIRNLSISSIPSLKITQEKTYRYGDLSGASLVISNKAKEVAHITEEMIGEIFKNVELVSISNNFLAKASNTKAFVITRKAASTKRTGDDL